MEDSHLRFGGRVLGTDAAVGKQFRSDGVIGYETGTYLASSVCMSDDTSSVIGVSIEGTRNIYEGREHNTINI